MNLAAPVPYLITERGGEVSHLWVAGGRIFDPYTRGINQASGWVENGAVPRVALATPPGGDGRRQVEGIGPFANSAVSVTLPNDVLDFPGDFSAAIIWSRTSSGTAAQIFDNAVGGVSGFRAQAQIGAALLVVFDAAAGLSLASANAWSTTSVNVACFGRTGSTCFAKLNLGSIVSGAIPGGWVPATSIAAGLGTQRNGASTASDETIYESWFSNISPSDLLFTSIATEVKGRLGISAW